MAPKSWKPLANTTRWHSPAAAFAMWAARVRRGSAVVVPHALDPQFPPAQRHRRGISRRRPGRRRLAGEGAWMVVPYDVWLRMVEQDRGRRAGPVALPGGDQGASERAPRAHRRHGELKRLGRAGGGHEQCRGGPHGPSWQCLGRGDDRLGEELAAVDHVPSAVAAGPREARAAGPGRRHVEDGQHPVERRLGRPGGRLTRGHPAGHGCDPTVSPATLAASFGFPMRSYFSVIRAIAFRTVTGSAMRCSSQMTCILAMVSSSPSPILGPGVKAAGRCCMPWMTPIVW
jgi:hypothetical protein